MQNLESQQLRIRPVKTRTEWKKFHLLPRSLHKHREFWVEPLALQVRQLWAPRQPYFQHAKACAWIAERGSQVVGRISAQQDRLQAEQGRAGLGQFGQLEAIDDAAVFDLLLDSAADWLAGHGCNEMQGPFDLSINQQCALLVEGFDRPPMMMMGYAPPYYAEQLQRAGLSSCAELLAYRGRPDFQPPKSMTRILQRVGDRIQIEPITKSELGEKAGLLREIFNQAWANNWGFVPMTEAEFTHIVNDMKLLVRPGYVNLARFDGTPAAFMVTLPNLNEMIADLNGSLLPIGVIKLLWRIGRKQCRSARVPLMGVTREHQQSITGAALSYALMAATQPHTIRDGIECVEQSWILEQNRGMRSLIESLGMQITQRYRIYGKAIEPVRHAEYVV
ncbi:MAG: N-acetyltransferase [Pseudomonadota bacterium]